MRQTTPLVGSRRPVPRASGRLVFVNGEMVPEETAAVSIFDHGLLFGDGVYDTMSARRGLIFGLIST